MLHSAVNRLKAFGQSGGAGHSVYGEVHRRDRRQLKGLKMKSIFTEKNQWPAARIS